MSDAPEQSEAKPSQANSEGTAVPTQYGQVTHDKPVALVAMLVSLFVTSLCILAYDRIVRMPSTPRLGTVDIGEIFAANQAKTLKTLMATKAQVDPNALGTQAGQQMAQQLQAFSKACDCLLIASPAVFGANRAVPDFTAAIKAANGLTTTLRDLGLSPDQVNVAPPVAAPAVASTTTTTGRAP